jgi:hypothetical protein
MYYNDNLVSEIPAKYFGADADGNGDIQIGAQLWCGSSGVGDCSSSTYAEMIIDYLTIEYPIDIDEHITVNYHQSTKIENTAYAGKSIEVSPNNGSVIVKGKPNDDRNSLDLIATDYIKLLPGFHAEETSEFRAWIVDASSLNAKSNINENESHYDFDRYKVYPLPPTERKTDESISGGESIIKSAMENIQLKLDEDFGDKIIVYPNPTSGILIINNAFPDVRRIIVMDIMGRIHRDIDLHPYSYEIDLSELYEGHYYLIIYKENEIIRKRLVIKK